MAGTRAKAATAYASALQYFTPPVASCWRRTDGRAVTGLAFDLELNRAECEYLTGELALAEKRLEALSDRAETIIDSAAVTCVRINLYTNLDQSDKAVAVGLEYLQQFDGTWSLQDVGGGCPAEYTRALAASGIGADRGAVRSAADERSGSPRDHGCAHGCSPRRPCSRI